MYELGHLVSAQHKQQLLRDRVTGLVKGLECGLLVFGPGGNGKSHVIDEELKACGATHQKVNSHITPMALFHQLQRHREEIIVLEDCESLLNSVISIGILRSATFPSGTDRTGRPIRKVCYYHGKDEESFQFDGRIILLMNRGLPDTPEARALASRINCIDFAFSDLEMRALMREWATRDVEVNGQIVTTAECQMVVEFLLKCASEANRRLNLRMVKMALRDYLQADSLQSGLSWQDLVTSAVNEHPSILDEVQNRELRRDQHSRELELARSLAELDRTERVAKWTKETGKSQATFYRRRSELASIDNKAFAE